jgi:hypothetical protein
MLGFRRLNMLSATTFRMQSTAATTTNFRPIANFKVHVAPPMTDRDLIVEKMKTHKETEEPECYFPNHHKQPEKPSWIARKLNIRYSSYKLAAVASLITKKHIYDALGTLSTVDKKGGKIVESVLQACKKNGERKGFTTERMFVKTSIVGRGLSHKKLDIKGRGR